MAVKMLMVRVLLLLYIEREIMMQSVVDFEILENHFGLANQDYSTSKLNIPEISDRLYEPFVVA